MNMRKEWIRTDEEKQMRQLQKLAKEQRRLNRLLKTQQPVVNLPIVARKKKRLRIRLTNQDLAIQPVNMTDAKIFIVFLYLLDVYRGIICF